MKLHQNQKQLLILGVMVVLGSLLNSVPGLLELYCGIEIPMSCSISGISRCRNRDIILGSNGAVCLNSVSPMKYCRYGFIVMCATVISSENRYLSLMICDPSA